MANKKVIDLNTLSETVQEGQYILADSAGGTGKMNLKKIMDDSTGTLAEDVEQLQNDLSEEVAARENLSKNVDNIDSFSCVMEQSIGFNKVTNVIFNDIFSKNGISPTNGEDVDNGYNLRTNPFIYAKNLECARFSNSGPNSYIVRMYQYDKDKAFIQSNYYNMTAGRTAYLATIANNVQFVRFMIATPSYGIFTDAQVADVMEHISVDIFQYKTGAPAVIVNDAIINSPVIEMSYSNGAYSGIMNFPSDRYAKLVAGNKIVNLAGRSLDISAGFYSHLTIWFDIEADDFIVLGNADAQTGITPYCYYLGTIYGTDGIDLNAANGFTINGVLRHGTALELSGINNKKKLSFLGDSLTTFTGFSEASTDEVVIDGSTYTYWGTYYPHDDVDEVSDTYWWKLWHSILPIEQPVVSAVSRSRFRDNIFPQTGKCAPAFWNDDRLDRICANNPDFIFINGGTNDCFGWREADSVLPSTKDITALEALPNTTARGIYLTLSKLISKAPNAVIIGIIPKYMESTDITFSVYGEMCRTLRKCYENFGVPVIDLSAAGISANNVANYTFDKIHPNKSGMDLLSRYLEKQFANI